MPSSTAHSKPKEGRGRYSSVLTSSTPPQAELFVRIDYLPLSLEVLAWLLCPASTSPPKHILRQDVNKCHLQVGTMPRVNSSTDRADSCGGEQRNERPTGGGDALKIVC